MSVPFTPFHFGIGFAAKAAVQRRFFLSLFIVLQVAIDLESLYNLAYGHYPVHRFLHTFVGATLLAIFALALVLIVVRRWASSRGRRDWPARHFCASLLATCLFATWSHVVLDGIMHQDARPLWPLTDRNPLLSLIGGGDLHLVCLVLGFFGLVALAFQWLPRDHGA